jgi:hypothetical protein
MGPRSNFLLAGQSKRQSCISQSTTEAELVAASLGAKNYGIALGAFMKQVCEGLGARALPLIHHVDNQCVIEVVRTGRNPTMRHLGRVHGVSVGFLHEFYKQDDMIMYYVSSSLMAADIYTKAFVDGQKWRDLCNKIRIFTEEQIRTGDLTNFYNVLNEGSAMRCLDQPDRMPEELKMYDSGLGWHTKYEEKQYNVVREPKLYRVHPSTEYSLRTTWVKSMQGWKKVEDKVDWTCQSNPVSRISDVWIEKAVVRKQKGDPILG